MHLLAGQGEPGVLGVREDGQMYKRKVFWGQGKLHGHLSRISKDWQELAREDGRAGGAARGKTRGRDGASPAECASVQAAGTD